VQSHECSNVGTVTTNEECFCTVNLQSKICNIFIKNSIQNIIKRATISLCTEQGTVTNVRVETIGADWQIDRWEQIESEISAKNTFSFGPLTCLTDANRMNCSGESVDTASHTSK
jgi:hypothetical protein